jgi:hypothetical protein
MNRKNDPRKLRLRQIINKQPVIDVKSLNNKKSLSHPFNSSSRDRQKDNTHIMLQVQIFRKKNKIFNQTVRFLNDTYVEIYKFDRYAKFSSQNNIVFRKHMKKGSEIGLFEPNKIVFEIPIKIDHMLLYGSFSKEGYIIKVKNNTKYEYTIQEFII